MVIAHPKVTYLFSTVLDYLLEQGICKSSVVNPVGAEPGPVGGYKDLVGFLVPEGLLSQG